MGTVSGIIAIYGAKVGVYYFVLTLRHMHGERDFLLKYKTTLENQLFYKEAIIIFLEAFLENYFVGMLSYYTPEGSEDNSP